MPGKKIRARILINQKNQNKTQNHNRKMTPKEKELLDFISNPEKLDKYQPNEKGEWPDEYLEIASNYFKSTMFFDGKKGEKLMLKYGSLYEKMGNHWVPKHRMVKKVVFSAKDSDDEPTDEWTTKETVIYKECVCCKPCCQPCPPKRLSLKDKADWERKARNCINAGFMSGKYDSKKSINPFTFLVSRKANY